MLTKTTTIDEEKIFKDVMAKLEDNYTLTYVNYDDEIHPATLDNILKNGLEDQLYEIFSDQANYYANRELNKLLGDIGLNDDEINLFRDTEQYDELRMEIESRDDSNAMKEIFCRSRIRTRIMLHSNYDCWLPLWEAQGLYGKEDALEGIMKMLCLNPAKVKEEAIRQGIACHRAFPNLKYRNGKEVVSYEGFVRCLIECPNYGLWTFFGYFDMDALWNQGLWDMNESKLDSLTIPKGTKCTMFNDWNGGGSLDFTETIRPVTIGELKKRGASLNDCPRIYVDEKFKDARGYSSGEVYGDVISSKEILN